MLANQLKGVLDQVISPSQSVFIPGRLISDNIMVAYEVMHYLKRKKWGQSGYMALKIDMSKAYDRVEWDFLEAMLTQIGFNGKLVSLFMACVKSPTYQICHGGKEFGAITPTRGLRQRDPLSPYLFLICQEGLSAIIKDCENCGLLEGIKVSRGAPSLIHMFFADDCYLFCKVEVEEGERIQEILALFEKASGQKVNFDKSSIFFSTNTHVAVRDEICGYPRSS